MEIVKDAEAYLKQKKYNPTTDSTEASSVKTSGLASNLKVPKFIAKAPWYMDNGQSSSLAHQKKEQKSISLDTWHQKGFKSVAATKFRKGACENCGAMSHKTRDCLERPRKVGAKYTGKDIQPDEIIAPADLNFEAKRDRWNGYDPNEHTELIKEWELVEEKRRSIREEKARNKDPQGKIIYL
jgi:pre-mRNA-processing factor SLU7